MWSSKPTHCEESTSVALFERTAEQNQTMWKETACNTVKHADTRGCEGIKALFSDLLWIWSLLLTDCHTFTLTISPGRISKLPSGHPAVFKAFQRAFSLAFDSLLFLFFRRICVSFLFLFFSFMQSTLAAERDCWRNPQLFNGGGGERRGEEIKGKRTQDVRK